MHYQFLVKAKDEITLVKRLENDILLLYEDRDLLVVDKPYHMLTVADTKNRENTLYAQLSAYVKRKNKKEKIYIVHRLEKLAGGFKRIPSFSIWKSKKQRYITVSFKRKSCDEGVCYQKRFLYKRSDYRVYKNRI